MRHKIVPRLYRIRTWAKAEKRRLDKVNIASVDKKIFEFKENFYLFRQANFLQLLFWLGLAKQLRKVCDRNDSDNNWRKTVDVHYFKMIWSRNLYKTMPNSQ